MIKGIILDVDGIIVGEKVGYNSPDPHPDVISRLKTIEGKGIPISLCTAKPHFAIRQIIDDAGLRNLHITDGGAVIIDPLDNVILETHIIDKEIAKQVVSSYLEAGVYVEVYTVKEYVIDSSQQSELTKRHSHILQHEPRMAESLITEIGQLEVTKIMPVATDEADKNRLEVLFQPYVSDLTLSWGIHPFALPHQFGIITTQDISKQQAALKIAKHSNISPDELLGIGDSTSDWQFIEQCGYAGTLENGSPKLKKLIAGKDPHAYVGGSVDENGVLDIFDYFALLSR